MERWPAIVSDPRLLAMNHDARICHIAYMAALSELNLTELVIVSSVVRGHRTGTELSLRVAGMTDETFATVDDVFREQKPLKLRYPERTTILMLTGLDRDPNGIVTISGRMA